MPITQWTMTEDERWAAAARMLETYGDEVGDMLIAKINRLMEEGHQALARDWIDICEKVQRLYGPDGGA